MLSGNIWQDLELLNSKPSTNNFDAPLNLTDEVYETLVNAEESGSAVDQNSHNMSEKQRKRETREHKIQARIVGVRKRNILELQKKSNDKTARKSEAVQRDIENVGRNYNYLLSQEIYYTAVRNELLCSSTFEEANFKDRQI